MNRIFPYLALGLFIGAGAAACSDDSADPADVSPQVTVTGQSGLPVGQSVQLSAATVGAVDSGYTWRSVDELVATVDDDGRVTGVAAGETDVVARGVDSGVEGAHRIVVIAVRIDGDLDLVPFYDKWVDSGHADPTAEAFVHWDDEGEVPEACARCHTTPGYQDYIGADGTAFESVEAPHPTGSVIACKACHNDAASELSEVLFPSGERITGLGSEARCMTCHQGRASTDTVAANIANALAPDSDTPDEDLKFTNIHYYAAGATLMAGRVRGGYQYEGQVYDWRFRHVPGFDTCVGCHDPHSLEVRVDACAGCHSGVSDREDLRDIRMIASRASDYDGDGDTLEGIYYEVEGLKATLLADIRVYAAAHGGPICWAGASYPYWFQDTDGDGLCSGGEAIFPNGYAAWTERLTKAAYNYAVASKDPGGFAHNGKYMIQLLHDAISDLNAVAAVPRDMAAFARNDPGHFNGASEAARHWDADEEVSAGCSTCHGGSEGLSFYLQYGVGTGVEEPDNGLDCATCHIDYGSTYNLREVASVTFPSGRTVSDGSSTDHLCATCHAGRESGVTVDAAIAANAYGFKNVHYLPSGGTRYGADAHTGYQFSGKSYVGAAVGHPGGDGCVDCHAPVATNHSFRVRDNFASCTQCHTTASSVATLRWPANAIDTDGDANATEPLHEELTTLADALLTRIQAVAQLNGAAICYGATSYPYFFVDKDEDGVCGPGEAIFPNRYTIWTPGLMQATYNYQYFQKDPGAWAHNFAYMAQLLIDSVEALGGDVSGYNRPE